MTVSTKIFKNGNSLAVRLNKSILRDAGLHENDEVLLSIDKATGNIVISPDTNGVNSSFKQLLKYSMDRDRESLEFLKDK